jgi:integrase
MPRTMGRLTALKVQKANQPGMYADGGGLYLQITPGGASWIYRYMLKGSAREMGLGPLALYGLQEARAKALDARRLRQDGIDPIEARKAARAIERTNTAKTITFKQCAESYIKAHRAGWRNAKHAAQWEATLATYAEPIIGALPVQAIDTALIMKALEQEVRGVPSEPTASLWMAKPETASRLRGRIESILDWAKVRGHREGENPARWRGHLDKLLPAHSKVFEVKHHPAMPYAELPNFLVNLRAREAPAARLLEFTILTALRTDATRCARWNEIDFDEKRWAVPAERMKRIRGSSGKEHRVPLSARALAILQEMWARRPAGDADAFVFPGPKIGKPLSDMAMLNLLERMGVRDRAVTHGFRSTFRDWAAECTNFPGEVAEMALGHVVSNKVEAAYRRGDLFDRRRKLMAAWETFCTTPRQAAQNNVTLMRRNSRLS